MTIKELFANYAKSCEEDYGNQINLKDVIFDLLKCLSEAEFQSVETLWKEIEGNSLLDPKQGYLIDLPTLRKILENHNILKSEKDGM